MPQRNASQVTVLLVALAISGCAGAKLPTLPKVSLPARPIYPEPPAEIYTRIARGALGCWFAPSGPLKRTHIFDADVAPPSEHAGAEIVIHERDPAAPSPRSLRSYRIRITPIPEGTLVASENLKLPAALAGEMDEDVRRWASGGEGCNPAAPQGWAGRDLQSPGTTAAIPARLPARGR